MAEDLPPLPALGGTVNEADWREVLSPDVETEFLAKSREAKVHLVVSLILFLQLPLSPILLFLFTTDHSRVNHLASNFCRIQGNTTPSDESYFPPSTLYHLWHEWHKKCCLRLHKFIVTPCAIKMVEEESTDGINDPELKVKLSKLTMKDIQDILNPGKLLNKYMSLFPFMYALLLAFCASPNRHRKYNLRGKAPSVPDMDDEAEFLDDGLEEDEFVNPEDEGEEWKDWRKDPRWAGFSRCPLHAIVLVFSILLFVRNKATNFLPIILGIFLKIGGAGSRIISVFSKMGVCISDRTIELVKARLSADANQVAVDYIQSGKLFYFIFDNINLYLRKHEQRLQNQNRMLNLTNAAIMPFSLASPEVEAQAADLKAYIKGQGGRAEAEPAEFMPTEEDDTRLEKSFKAIVVQLIASYAPGCKDWPKYKDIRHRAVKLMPRDRPLPVEKSTTFPFGIFDVNEGSKDGVREMMGQLQKRSGLSEKEFSSKAQIVQGDWLTVNNLRLGKRERFEDIDSMERVEYAMPLGALWHTGYNAVKMIVKTHKGEGANLLDPASLKQHKDVLNRTWDINDPDYAPSKSLIRHSLIARILHLVMTFTSMLSWSDFSAWRPTFEQILSIADWIVTEFANSTAARSAMKAGDDYLARSMLFMRDALLFLEFESAVSFADPGRVLHVLKYWAFAFRGAGMHNYARECLEVLIKWKYELTTAQRAAMERAWFVNKFGLPGRWIAADLYIEYLNYWIKRVFIAQGSNLTEKYIMEKGSACVEAFHQIAEHVSKLFGNAERKRRHKEVHFYHDLEALINDMLQKSIHTLTADRIIEPLLPKKRSKNAQASGEALAEPELEVHDKLTIPGTRKSGVIDLFITGAAALQGGKFNEFIEKTVIDPSLGYPLTESDERTERSGNDRRELGEADVEGNDVEPVCPGVGGLGGGEFA